MSAPDLDTQVTFDVTAGVATITLNRPEVKNAVTYDQRVRLMELLEQCAERLDVRVVVLTGSGDSFCTGADLRSLPTPAPRPEGAPDRTALEVARGIRTNAQRVITTILDIEKPVIAAVNGVAAGMGFHVALACDLIIAAESARFIEAFARRALVPDAGGAYFLSRLIGPHRAKQLLFFGDDLSATAAAEMGLVNEVVADDQLADTVAAWSERLANGPTRAIALTKLLVNRSMDMDRTSALTAESTFQDLNMTTADAQEGVASFVERRAPDYKGW